MTSLALATTEDLGTLLPMRAGYCALRGLDPAADTQTQALAPLLAGEPLGVVYIAGPRRAPVGYVVVTFGWSVRRGGLEGVIDELWVRPAVRRRGIGTSILSTLPKALAGAGLTALHIDADHDASMFRDMLRRLQFRPQEETVRMSCLF